jgi:hypothetical protein
MIQPPHIKHSAHRRVPIKNIINAHLVWLICRAQARKNESPISVGGNPSRAFHSLSGFCMFVGMPAPSPDVNEHLGGRAITKMETRIPAGEFLVYYFLTRDHVRCDRDGQFLNGSNEAGTLFESLDQAKALAISVAGATPRIGAGVYSCSYKVVAEFLPEAFIRQQAAANSPTRLFLWAGALLVGGSAFMWIEVRSGWTAMFGFLIGSRLLVGSAFRFAKGMYRLRRSRSFLTS